MKRNDMMVSDHFIYTPSTTDVTIRWRANHGWIPPTEDPEYQKKWADFRMKCAKVLRRSLILNLWLLRPQ